MMQKTKTGLYAQVISKGLNISKHKGVLEAKRMMMRAGLPVDAINSALLPDRTAKKEISNHVNND